MSTEYRIQNPATGETVKTYPTATDEEITRAIDNAAGAYADWAAKSFDERGAALHRLAQALRDNEEKLSTLSATEMGKPYEELIEEIQFSAEIIDYYADNGADFAADQSIPTPDGEAVIRRLPIGALLGIMPWNFPYYQVARFIAPNLMLGNTIILKHAEICPGSAEAIAELCAEAGLPEGVYNNVFASHDQVSTIIESPKIQGVSLTGSERAGAAVAEQAGRNLKKVVLELGGTDPYIVLDTDDIAAAAKLAWQTRMVNTGQACNSNKRIIVMDDIYEDFVSELVSLASGMRPTTFDQVDENSYCPLSSRQAAEDLNEQLRAAVAEGANLRVGGELSETGAYVSPAVITDIPRGSDSYYQEFFGPVAEVYRVSSDEEAVELANDSQYGLGGAVFASDEERARRVAARLEVGMANVNTPAGEGAELPFGGVKRSGYGRELGPLGMDEFVNKQMYYVAK
ncbi:NAD-dependent succinate-semialdehyde dehydrogenase [Corynebacterium frankenforstense]|uniref:NAD-dependent succinate-semialdehyde dehydrogenase n=1 Tax=Corynebacterium TaxID=1716 RepID=UPI002550CA2D|nr:MULTISPECIES: NAD-dependent succinate-semialdehyde dehydrogenase [Corynebacterium]MDK6259621.1 NAD-dependent succinate-semialdehyde dehydrogenase [Corynebacterium frankenforstense]MDK8894819.1 NAD-dependent succinate-semialdehyde dehydrogenase [Corynebacterium sp. MSK006]